MQQTQETKDTCPDMFEVSQWPEYSLGKYVQGMQIVADCSSLGNGYGKELQSESDSCWYVCLPCVGKAVCVKEDLIKPEGKSWVESCQTCGRRTRN